LPAKAATPRAEEMAAVWLFCQNDAMPCPGLGSE